MARALSRIGAQRITEGRRKAGTKAIDFRKRRFTSTEDKAWAKAAEYTRALLQQITATREEIATCLGVRARNPVVFGRIVAILEERLATLTAGMRQTET